MNKLINRYLCLLLTTSLFNTTVTIPFYKSTECDNCDKSALTSNIISGIAFIGMFAGLNYFTTPKSSDRVVNTFKILFPSVVVACGVKNLTLAIAHAKRGLNYKNNCYNCSYTPAEKAKEYVVWGAAQLAAIAFVMFYQNYHT